ncbi:hypothetical protein HYC85_011922 [Camellia sinensis]|uniref:Uncharacterized protein n=1 Tax=Camellia sinensis TaxID=4442 RepID=A0A7J7HB03_CAMSI|nr:hypothetical protein HYC85_011922 [Camellia sinensis]
MLLRRQLEEISKALLYDEESGKDEIMIDEDAKLVGKVEKALVDSKEDTKSESSGDFGEKLAAIRFGSLLPNTECNIILVLPKKFEAKPRQLELLDGYVEDLSDLAIMNMIVAISWVPKGVSRSIPAMAEPPSKEEIKEILNSRTFERCEESENEDHDEDMVVDAAKQGDEVAHALVAANALGKASLSTTSVPFQDIADSLQELDMEHYDEEDDGVELIGTGIGDAYYPSNDMDPYSKDQNNDDSEEVEDMTITAEDAVIVCAHNEDDVWIYEDPADGDSNMYVHHDIIIPAFPLCTAWLDSPIKGGDKGMNIITFLC